MRRAIPNTIELESKVAAFNRRYKSGIACEVQMNDGSLKETETASEAWVLGGHSPVIMLKGVAGAYSLDRVYPLVSKAELNKL